jgi:nitric oxide reductase subunit B
VHKPCSFAGKSVSKIHFIEQGETQVKPNRKLWQWLGVVFVLSFGVLGWLGREIYLAAPPIPKAVVTTDGTTLYTGSQIDEGQRAWRTAGGQQLGSVWGHGSYVAPDWSADWLHREAVALRAVLAQKLYGAAYESLPAPSKAAVDATLKDELRTNTYDAATGTVTVSKERARAIAEVGAHYDGLFGNDARLEKLRGQYAMGDNLLASAADMRDRLENAQDALAEAVEDLKKVELLDQREHQREVDEQNKAEQAEFDEIARMRFRR